MGDPSTPSDLELDLWMKIQAGDFDHAFAMAARLLIVSDDSVQRGRVETAIGLMMQRAGLTADSRDQFARALALVGDSGPDRALVLAVGSLSSVLAGALDQAEADANEALVLAAQHDFDFPVRQARTTLAVVNLGRGRLGEALACAEAAASYDDKGIGQAEYRSTAYVVLAMVLAELDRMPEAHATIAEGIRIAQDEGDTGQLAWYLASQAMLHFIDGSWEAAREETRRSLDRAERTGALAARPLAWGIAACIEGLRGNVADARVLIARSRAHRLGPGGGLGEEWVALAVAASTDDADERYDALCEAWFRLRGMPSFLAWKVFAYPLVVLAVQRGDHVLATAVSERVGELAEVAGTISARATALCCSAATSGSPESLDAGLELLRASGRPLPLAFGCVAAARTTADPARRSAALHEAAAVFHALGATTWSALVTRQLVRVAAEPPDVPTGPWHLLTPGEQRVVRLAVQGLSNPAIAEQLGVSSRTVQAQLASACRKCGVPGRVLLAGLFAG
ncbi:LuxR C-terminal-related transcriptional regulator [Nocardioides sp. GCM10030258]|uniref:LuxR C-terminal-related transcriptional regulator n=1 Tax=unclassified Nocardioides TaxID=2615069 RepID=UPI00361609D3